MVHLSPTQPPANDGLGAYLEGVERSKDWDKQTFGQMGEAVANNPYGVWSAVNRQLLGREQLPSRQQMLRTGGTTDQIGRGSVIHNMHNAAWGAIFGAAGMRHSEARVLDVVMHAGRQRDEAFQPATTTWTNAQGESVSGPVFSWERWDGKAWVDER
jgi:hypothetical protein